MSSSSIKRFQRLLTIRKAQENEGAVALGGRLAELQRIEHQRDLLVEYQSHYVNANLPNDARILKQIALLQQQLRGALQQQEGRLVIAEKQVEQARSAWMEMHQASLSLEKLIERRRRIENTLDGRKQQYEQDLWATRKAFQKTDQDLA
ncbi:flagellar export protein FliJ [Chromatium okenii]|uniref:flagellar export protein FliJ n=1 Tax=Chromatium okenii TaxID=61644 RepID=UPI0026ED8688|nr:flagellar FliJ family protein [Chromatium okenii]MBV5308579.1 flagellar FliJ family protein [Chromatium okenii]